MQTPQFRQCEARRKTVNGTSQMRQVGLDAKGCIWGGAQARARAMACFCVGTEKARKDLELSSTLLASNAFWFVFTVATQDRVVSEKMTEDGSNVRGSTEAPILARSAPSRG